MGGYANGGARAVTVVTKKALGVIGGAGTISADSPAATPARNSVPVEASLGDPVLLLSAVFVLALEIKLDLDVVWIAQKNLPTGTVWNLVRVVRDSFFGEMPLRCREAAAGESYMINDAKIGTLLLLGL